MDKKSVGRVPTAPPTKKHKDITKYKRKKKHIEKDKHIRGYD